MSGHFTEITLAELTTPREGYTVMLNWWWMTRNGNPLDYVDGKYHYAQCNKSEQTVRLLLKRYIQPPNRDPEPLFVPVAYWRPNPD